MLPLIPAILLLLLHGPANYERFPQDAKLPDSWSMLQRASSRDGSDDAVFARLLAIAAVQTHTVARASFVPGECPPDLERALPVRSSSAGPVESFQDCRRTRDGPDSIA